MQKISKSWNILYYICMFIVQICVWIDSHWTTFSLVECTTDYITYYITYHRYHNLYYVVWKACKHSILHLQKFKYGKLNFYWVTLHLQKTGICELPWQWIKLSFSNSHFQSGKHKTCHQTMVTGWVIPLSSEKSTAMPTPAEDEDIIYKWLHIISRWLQSSTN